MKKIDLQLSDRNLINYSMNKDHLINSLKYDRSNWKFKIKTIRNM